MSASTAWGFTAEPADRWRDRAACLNEDPERFFPTDIESAGPQTVEAQAFCRLFCAVKDDCLKWALGHGIDHGVWGGTTPAERRGTRRARANLADGKCRNGHPWTAENVRHDRRGGEYCVPCRQGWGAKARAKQMQRKAVAHAQ